MDDFFSYLIICVCIVGIIILMKKGKDGAGPNSRFGNFRNILLFVILGIAMQFISSSSYAFTIYNVDSRGYMLYSGGSTNSYMVPYGNSDSLDWTLYSPNSDNYYYVNNGQGSSYRIFRNMNYSLYQATSSTCDNSGLFGYYTPGNKTTNIGQFNGVNGWYMTTSSSYSPTVKIFPSGGGIGQCVSYNIPGITYRLNNEGIDFIYMNTTPARQVYSLPSRAGSSVAWSGNTYQLTNAVPYMNTWILFDDDDDFFMQLSPGGSMANGFLVAYPGLTENNLFYVAPRMHKAWSTTITTFDAWRFLFGYLDLQEMLDRVSFEKSYTLTRGGTSILPPGFSPANYGEQGIIYTEDLAFATPPGFEAGGGAGNGGGSAWGPDEVDSTVNILDAIKGTLDTRGERICKSTNGALLYQNDFEQYLGTYAKYKNNCEYDVYAPTPYDNGTGSTWSLKALWTWVQNQALTLVGDTNNENVCAYADYLSGRVHAFVNSIDCSTCKEQYLNNLMHDFGSGVVDGNLCIDTDLLLNNVKEVIKEETEGTAIDPTTDNVNKMASRLLSTFKDPYMSGYRAIITPTCYYGQNFERANYLLYGIFAIYIFILFKLLH